MSLQATNKLRHFANEDELFDTTDNDVILGWVNELAALKFKRQAYHRRRNLEQAEFARLAKQMLEPDERERVLRVVDEKIEGEG